MSDESARSPVPWQLEEPGWADFVEELRRLSRRNRRDPWPLLLLVLLCTGLALLRANGYRPSYEARIALRLTEPDLDLDAYPRPASKLRAWVADIALNDANLLRVAERLDPYPGKSRNVDQLLEALRDDIDVEVWRNEFITEGPRDPIGRSARVALTYHHKDPKIAFGVVEMLAEATVTEQRRTRRLQAEMAARGIGPALESARGELTRLRTEQAQRMKDAEHSPVAAALLAHERSRIDELAKLVQELSTQQADVMLRLQAEQKNLGLHAEIIDTRRPAPRPYRLKIMLVLGSLGFFGSLLLGGVVIKAFDRRIYEPEDLRRLGYPVWGALPAFAGDDVGSMRDRVRMSKHDPSRTTS